MPMLRGKDGDNQVNIEIDLELYKDLIRYTNGVASKRLDVASEIFSSITEDSLLITTELAEERLRKRMGSVAHV
ncbi:MAG: hypothetical protein ISR98_01745 [Parcubacteria group bacterium]|nr:hypothetical protein [Parcubacteria group bacterium]